MHTEIYFYIFVHIYAYLSLLFNFAMEEHLWLGNKFQRPHLYHTANGKENISGQKHHSRVSVRQNCEYFVALFLRQKLILDLFLCSEEKLRTLEFWDQNLSIFSDNVEYSLLLTVYSQKVPQR